MSDITLNPAQRQPQVADTTQSTARATTQPTSASTADSTTNVPSDQINLSPAAQVATAGFAGPTLSDRDAVTTSVGLRQSIGSASLSVSAKQNQAILSLLR